MDERRRVVEALVASSVFKAYRTAFHRATGIELSIEPIALAVDGEIAGPGERPLIQTSNDGTYRAVIPIMDGKHLVGLLCTTPMADTILCHGGACDEYCASGPARGLRCFPLARFSPYLTLLTIFANQLGDLSNRLVIHQEHCEPAVVVKARQFVQERFREPIELNEVARFSNVSTFYLCKLFKRTTGLKFSHYVTRVRVEAAKEMLRNPEVRVSEVALQVGFRSLSHFNRVFKRSIGSAPREYRRCVLFPEESWMPEPNEEVAQS